MVANMTIMLALDKAIIRDVPNHGWCSKQLQCHLSLCTPISHLGSQDVLPQGSNFTGGGSWHAQLLLSTTLLMGYSIQRSGLYLFPIPHVVEHWPSCPCSQW